MMMPRRAFYDVGLNASNSCRGFLVLLQNMEPLCRTAVTVLLALSLFLGLGVGQAAPAADPDALMRMDRPEYESGNGDAGDLGNKTTITITEEPISIPIIKNPQCRLHKQGKSKTCGMRELKPAKGRGVVFWNPRVCQKLHCQCQAVRDVLREKRGIADNRTVIEHRRFRIFECF